MALPLFTKEQSSLQTRLWSVHIGGVTHLPGGGDTSLPTSPWPLPFFRPKWAGTLGSRGNAAHTHTHTQAAAGGFCHVLPQVGTPPIHLQGREKRRRCRCSPFLGTWSERKEGRKGKRQTRCAQHENGCLICQRVLFVCACLHVSVCDQNIRKTREKQHLFSHCAGWPSLR